MLFAHLIVGLSISNYTLVNYAISVVASYILHFISFVSVRLFYTKGVDGPATGSFMYFIAYANYTYRAWLGLKRYILTASTGNFIDIMLYIAIGLIIVVSIVGLILLKRCNDGGGRI